MENYSVNYGKIVSLDGLPYGQRWFCDNRVSFKAENNCITEIDFFGENTKGSYMLLYSRFWGGMKFYINDVMLRVKNCEVMPFGYSSGCDLAAYSVYAFNNTIYFSFVPKQNSDIRLEFNDDFLHYPEQRVQKDIRCGGPERIWSKFSFKDNSLVADYVDNGTKNSIRFTSNKKSEYIKRAKNGKNILAVNDVIKGEKIIIALSFCDLENDPFENYEKGLAAQFKRYETVSRRAPILKSKHKYLNQFFQLAPIYHESLKVMDVEGAIRAQSTHYWVWGWDSMTSNECCFYWGDDDFIGKMLKFLQKYSDEKFGIAHAFTYDMKNCDPAPPPAQGMYITLLDYFRLAGGKWQQYYGFAKSVFKLILNSECDNSGLCKGISLYPDFRGLIHETGNDISCFNNTVSYCAIRSMQALAAAMNDSETEQVARDFADRLKKNFRKYMFNEEYGFFDSSIDSETLKPRNVLSNNAVKWENGYCKDLVEGFESKSLKFYFENLVTPAGIRPVPKWSDCYDADSNQLHCWWIVMSEYYTRLLNSENQKMAMELYLSWVEYWTKKLMCPEGIPCYDENFEVPFDNWNCQNGIWHAYSIRGFYNAVVHSYIGVDFDNEGINFYPYSGDEVEIANLHFGSRSFDISMCGSGNEVENVILNGKELGNVLSIPFADLEKTNTIKVIRK